MRTVRTATPRQNGMLSLGANVIAEAIQIDAVSQYGQVRYYVHDASTALQLQVLTGNITLSESQIEALRALGHEVTVTPALRKPR